MKIIKAHSGEEIMVSDEDYDQLSKHRWYAHLGYAITSESGTNSTIRMHRMIMGFPNSWIDHRDNNRLNNQRENLRVATTFQNAFNSIKPKSNTSGYKGVSWSKRDRKWDVRIKSFGKQKLIGLFTYVIEAALAYDYWARVLHGEFALVNFPNVKAPVPIKYMKVTESGYKGVSRVCGKSLKWKAAIMSEYKSIHLGCFDLPEEAARAYDAKALELFGDRALLNFPKQHKEAVC